MPPSACAIAPTLHPMLVVSSGVEEISPKLFCCLTCSLCIIKPRLHRRLLAIVPDHPIQRRFIRCWMIFFTWSSLQFCIAPTRSFFKPLVHLYAELVQFETFLSSFFVSCFPRACTSPMGPKIIPLINLVSLCCHSITKITRGLLRCTIRSYATV